MNKFFAYLWISVFILLLLSTMTAGSYTQERQNSTPFQNSSYDLFSPDYSGISHLSILDRNSVLLTAIEASEIKTGPVVKSEGTGWQNVTLPAVISEPGNYRIMNDYTASKEEIGLVINVSDVHVDGNGHLFTGSFAFDCYGLVATNDAPIANISVSNFNTRTCNMGIVYYGVLSGEIINTTHTMTTGGISVGNGGSIHIARNTISGYTQENPSSETFGLSGMNASDLIVEENQVSDIGSTGDGIHSVGIMLVNAGNSTIQKNILSGSLAAGISIENPEEDSGSYTDILDNTLSSVDSLGIMTQGGLVHIANNTIRSGKNGLAVLSDNSYITRNIIRDNTETGFSIHGRNLTLRENILTNNTCNMYMGGYEPSDFLHHIARTNLINGKPLVYIRDAEGTTIGPVDNPGMVFVVNSHNLTIRDITTEPDVAGVFLVNTTGSTVSNVTDSGSLNGFYVMGSKNCSISDFSASGKKGYGCILFNTQNITISGCTILQSSGTGMLIQVTGDTHINNCTVTGFSPDYREEDASGIDVSESHDLVIQDSEFSHSPYSGAIITNSKQVSVQNTTFMGNGEYGISCMQDSFVSVNNSFISDNGMTGISMDFISNFTLNRNIVTGNKKSGLLFLDGADGIITDNLFNNSENVIFVYDQAPLVWNSTLLSGENIVHGPYLGGNFWANLNGTGFSEIHADRGDGICNASYELHPENVDYLPLAVPSGDIIPDFIAGPVSGTPPLKVRFSDNSTGYPKAWNWTFGDGTESHEQNPVHTYSGIGRYSVTLEITGKNGRQGIIEKPAFIAVNPGRIIGPNGMIFVNSTPQNASVYLDSLFIGLTPLKAIGIPAGSHKIMIAQDGYQNRTDTIWVKTNEMTYVPAIPLRKK